MRFPIFFFNVTATTEIYTLSLHDALPISCRSSSRFSRLTAVRPISASGWRSEEHTSELQSQFHLVCRLLLEKKKICFADLSTTVELRAATQTKPSHEVI